MRHQIIKTSVSIFTTDPLRLFISQNSLGLAHAARLLAGTNGMRCVERIVDAASQMEPLTRTASKDLQTLHNILSLEHVDDPERPEAGYFAMIDPADPVVEDICLLTDGLRQALTMSHSHGSTSRPVAVSAAA